jgi:hypothetical protein
MADVFISHSQADLPLVTDRQYGAADARGGHMLAPNWRTMTFFLANR